MNVSCNLPESNSFHVGDFVKHVTAGVFGPVRDGDRVTGELSGDNELPDAFLEWLELLHKDILQAGQYFCYSASNEFLQGGRDTWRKFLVQVEILHRGKWE
jgi:hypothetical protein